jgi:hypothetical protein
MSVERRTVHAYAMIASLLTIFMTTSFAQTPDYNPNSSRQTTTAATSTAPTSSTPAAATAPRAYPKEIRGYKVERARVEIKKQKDAGTSPDVDALIQFGEARIVSTTPLGITLEVPVTVAAVKQGGHVDFLAFEDMIVNGTPVTVEDYMHPFDLPNKRPVALPQPVRLFISTPRALLGALGEWSSPKEMWPVTGRVYVFGRFKKFLFNFKRVVPVELSLSLPNPLKDKQPEPATKQ